MGFATSFTNLSKEKGGETWKKGRGRKKEEGGLEGRGKLKDTSFHSLHTT